VKGQRALAMLKLLKSFFLSLLVWYVIVGSSVLGLYMLARASPVGPEAQSYFMRLIGLGAFVIIVLWPICRLLHGLAAVSIGTSFGLAVPILAGWVWLKWIERWDVSRGLLWNGMDLWIQGFQIAIPSALAGGIVGYFLGRQGVPHRL
jgi:hypothetical protein